MDIQINPSSQATIQRSINISTLLGEISFRFKDVQIHTLLLSDKYPISFNHYFHEKKMQSFEDQYYCHTNILWLRIVMWVLNMRTIPPTNPSPFIGFICCSPGWCCTCLHISDVVHHVASQQEICCFVKNDVKFYQK